MNCRERIVEPVPFPPLYKTIFSSADKKLHKRSIKTRVKAFFPIVRWLPEYPRNFFVLLAALIFLVKLEGRCPCWFCFTVTSRHYYCDNRYTADNLIFCSCFRTSNLWPLFFRCSALYLLNFWNFSGLVRWSCGHQRDNHHLYYIPNR